MRELSIQEIEYVSGGEWWNDLAVGAESLSAQLSSWISSMMTGGSRNVNLSAEQVYNLSNTCMSNQGSVTYNTQGQQVISGTMTPGTKSASVQFTNISGQSWTCTYTPAPAP